ncbi:hypothetical protein RIF29_24577 [Crotalaria pallida]|uniref:Uncharacterized protein n=1 Tax=Crotalaria pallida TaxID=3830 RepID=A0AAN9HWR3_CROPI
MILYNDKSVAPPDEFSTDVDEKNEHQVKALVSNLLEDHKTHTHSEVTTEELRDNAYKPEWHQERVEELRLFEENCSFDDSVLTFALQMGSKLSMVEIRAFPTPPPKPPDRSSYGVFLQSSFNITTQFLPPQAPMVLQPYMTLALILNEVLWAQFLRVLCDMWGSIMVSCGFHDNTLFGDFAAKTLLANNTLWDMHFGNMALVGCCIAWDGKCQPKNAFTFLNFNLEGKVDLEGVGNDRI